MMWSEVGFSRLGAALAAGWALAACGGRAESSALGLNGEALTRGAEFVAIGKPRVAESRFRPAPDVQGLPDSDADFYLAIRRSSLSQRWFLSANFKQFHPGGAAEYSNTLLGIRVVRFELQNDRLFVFDASDQLMSSRVEDPTVLLEAYPIVSDPRFDDLPHSEDYVLIDPSAGLNQIGVTGDTFGDPLLAYHISLDVGLSFLQNFRTLRDGAAFEQVFSGALDLGNGGPESVWGTLGVALRRYREGAGYQPPLDPDGTHLFVDGVRLVPDSGGEVALSSTTWNFHPGMTPLNVSIRGGAFRAAADFPEADVLGALVRGVEGWNDAFGFPVFRAELVDSDEVPDEDQLFMMVDYPGSGVDFAFANFQSNPNSGEMLAGSVYLSGEFYYAYELETGPEPEAETEPPSRPPPARSVSWAGLQASAPVCNYPPPRRRPHSADPALQFTSFEEADRFLEQVVSHEFGHVLGLRHNFKGSLLPPTSSVMDYNTDADSALHPKPGQYDIDALRYFYHLADQPPAQPFCTDEDLAVDPLCAQFDSGADPLRDYWLPTYRQRAEELLGAGETPDVLDFGLDALLGFARTPADGGIPELDPSTALRVALEPARIPMSAEDAASAERVSFANAAAELVLRRAVLDAPESRGFIAADITDAAALALLGEVAGSVVRNEDGVRPYALRRVAVDVLRSLQSAGGLRELRRSKMALEDALAAYGAQEPDDAILLEDLITRIDAALNPYFD